MVPFNTIIIFCTNIQLKFHTCNYLNVLLTWLLCSYRYKHGRIFLYKLSKELASFISERLEATYPSVFLPLGIHPSLCLPSQGIMTFAPCRPRRLRPRFHYLVERWYICRYLHPTFWQFWAKAS